MLRRAHARSTVLTDGIALAWWLNPLSMGALGYIFSNMRAWRLWTLLGLFMWAGVNPLVSMAIASDSARIMIVNGLIVVGYILLGLLFLYIQLRVFIWAASGKPTRFFFGIMGWAAFNGLIYWAIINPEVSQPYPGRAWVCASHFVCHWFRCDPICGDLLVHGAIACGDDSSRRPQAGDIR